MTKPFQMKNFLFTLLLGTLISTVSCQSPSETGTATQPETPAPQAPQAIAPNPNASMKDGENELYYPNGRLKMKGEIRDSKRQGLWTSWYDSGIKWSEDTYSMGVKDGRTTSFYPNGQARYIGYYTNDVRSGIWRFYDEEGNLIKEENYSPKD